MADGQRGRLWVLTGESHDLDDRLGSEGGGSTRTRLIGEDGGDEPEQLGVGGAFSLGGFEAGSRLGPTLAPDTSRLPMQGELTGDLLIGLAIGSKTDNLKAPEQLLGGVLAAGERVQQLPQALWELDGNWARAGHAIASFGAVRSREVGFSEPKYIPSNPWRRISAAMY
jgi:hypothetical protein